MQNFPDDAVASAISLIRQFEGCRLTAYQDQGGIWTIGWGDTENVQPGMTITQADADQRLVSRVDQTARGADNALAITLTASQAGACIDLAYNIVVGAFAGSTLLKDINRGNFSDVPTQFLRWNKVGGQPNAGLTRRRQAEINLWESDAPTA